MNLKNNKTKTKTRESDLEDFGKVKPKKKPAKLKESDKINLKSKKFWQDRFDDEGEDLEKFLR